MIVHCLLRCKYTHLYTNTIQLFTQTQASLIDPYSVSRYGIVDTNKFQIGRQTNPFNRMVNQKFIHHQLFVSSIRYHRKCILDQSFFPIPHLIFSCFQPNHSLLAPPALPSFYDDTLLVYEIYSLSIVAHNFHERSSSFIYQFIDHLRPGAPSLKYGKFE